MEVRDREFALVETIDDRVSTTRDGYRSLQETIEEYDDDFAEKETVSDFLGTFLTSRQIEVVHMVQVGTLHNDTTDGRLWTKLKNGVFNHPVVVNKIASILDTSVESLGEQKWKESGSCISDTRFVGPRIKSSEDKERLISICESCPVYDECIEYVGDKKPERSFWAGSLRTREGSGKGVGYHEGGIPITIQEAKQKLSDPKAREE